jgi:hypothetical protein
MLQLRARRRAPQHRGFEAGQQQAQGQPPLRQAQVQVCCHLLHILQPKAVSATAASTSCDSAQQLRRLVCGRQLLLLSALIHFVA